MSLVQRFQFTTLFLTVAISSLSPVRAGESLDSLHAVLRSDAPLHDKGVACRRLAVIGDRQSIPVLAELLNDKALSQFARTGLEAIPDPAVDEVFRAALSRVKGAQLVGVLNSIGNRRDSGAIGQLAELVKSGEPLIQDAAAAALGRVGNTESAKRLHETLGGTTGPHDPVDTGRKTARVMFDLLAGRCRPTMAWRKIPLITPQDQFLTSQGPMKEWFDLAREMERRPGVIDVSPYPMQPWLDVEEGGWAVVVHTDGDQKLAEELAKEIAARAWSLREKFWESARTPVADAVRQAVAAESGLIILSDTGDSVYGGSPGDSTCILRELLRQNVPCQTLVPMVDVAAVEAAHAAGVGARIRVSLGGSVDRVFSQPVPVDARVAGISNGVTLELPDRGPCDLGRAALLEIGAIRLVALDSRTFAINHPSLYMHLGLDINDAKIVVLKTASNFQFFSRWRKGLIRVDSPGTTQSDLTAFDWKRVPRPIYPLDPVSHYAP